MADEGALTIRRVFTSDAATLPLPVKTGFAFVLILAIALVMMATGDVRLGPLDSAVAAETGQTGSGGPVTTCDLDDADDGRPAVLTFTAVNQYGSIADTFYSVDEAPFVGGMLVSLPLGTHTLRFYSTDEGGRAGPVTSVTLTVR